MKYTLENGKSVRIDDKVIENSMKVFGISKDEAVQMWLEDEGYLDNEEQNDLDEAAQKVKISRGAKSEEAASKKKASGAKKGPRPDAAKESIIQTLYGLLSEVEEYADIEIVHQSKIITFKLGDESFKLDLSRQGARKKKSA